MRSAASGCITAGCSRARRGWVSATSRWPPRASWSPNRACPNRRAITPTSSPSPTTCYQKTSIKKATPSNNTNPHTYPAFQSTITPTYMHRASQTPTQYKTPTTSSSNFTQTKNSTNPHTRSSISITDHAKTTANSYKIYKQQSTQSKSNRLPQKSPLSETSTLTSSNSHQNTNFITSSLKTTSIPQSQHQQDMIQHTTHTH